LRTWGNDFYEWPAGRANFMRWFWIDRFVEFESGRRAVALKAVTLAEEQLDGYLPGFPIMPVSLIVEGLAQTGGLLVGEHFAFRERVVLAKLGKAVFLGNAQPGDVLRYTATIEDIKPDGAIVRGTSYVGDRLQAEIELMFAYLDERFEGVEQFYPVDFLAMLRCFGLYDVGRAADGSPLQVPEYLLEAERTAVRSGE
jgi:3-hydroxyacyl-[acyl-carrier-protein] dehydratase